MIRPLALMLLLSGCVYSSPWAGDPRPGAMTPGGESYWWCVDPPQCHLRTHPYARGPGISLNNPLYYPSQPLYGLSQGPNARPVPGGLYGGVNAGEYVGQVYVEDGRVGSRSFGHYEMIPPR